MFQLLGRRAARPVAVIAFCLALLGWSSQSDAQSGGAGRPNRGSNKSAPYTIPVSVHRVVLDIVVTDSHGNPVHGLTKKDFTIFEQRQRDPKKQQDVRSFQEVKFDTPSTGVAPKLPPLPSDTYMNAATEPERGPLYVIVWDADHMEGGNPMSESDQGDQIQGRKQLAEFVASKPQGTRFALYLLACSFQQLQGFTTDRDKLLQAFDTRRKAGHIPVNLLFAQNCGAADPALPFTVMRFLGHYLEGLPGRKNLIWLSSQFPAVVPAYAIQAMTNTSSVTPAQGFADAAPTTMGESWDTHIMEQAIDALNAAQVSVYPVSVAGLKHSAGNAGIDSVAENIADATGGKAYYNTNGIKDAVQSATENGENYYELTYAPSDPREDGSMRHITVNLDRSDRKKYNLEYRRYYFAADPDAPLTNDEKKAALAVADQVVAHKPGDSMYAYMQHGAPISHDIVFRAQFHAGPAAIATPDQMANLVEQPAYFVVRKKDKPAKLPPPIPLRTYTIDYLVLDQNAVAHASGQVLEFAAGAYDNEGKLLNGISQDAVRGPATAGTKPGQQPFFRAQQTLDVPAAAVWLRVAVRDVNTDRIGTMEIPLPLPADQPTVASGQSAVGAVPRGSSQDQ